MKTISEIGVQIPELLLPNKRIDPTKWAVIACDQFTSEMEYWDNVAKIVGDSPSTYHLILPEVFLGTQEEEHRLKSTQTMMKKYLDERILEPFCGMILVERNVGGKTRHGLVLALDLEKYDFNKGSQTIIRATEGTILDRLPPRIKIRSGASLELPHILVLIDDPGRTVIEPLVEQHDRFPVMYDFELMMGSGHLKGYGINQQELEANVVNALKNLASPEEFAKKYGVTDKYGVLLFAMGDGNHSLATAKAIWEQIKLKVGLDHPARYALVEIENVHDSGLEFEPIHRVLFGIKQDHHQAFQEYFGENIKFVPMKSIQNLMQAVEKQTGSGQSVGIIANNQFELAVFSKPSSNLPVGTLQPFLDTWLKTGGAEKIDYVHGEDTVLRLGSQAGNISLILPAMPKADLFRTVILDGSLPRKTFSMGEAREKRFYMECRKIV
jgi:hypothetical protein